MKVPTKTVFLLLLPLLVISCGNEKPSPDSNQDQPTPSHIHAPSTAYAKDETAHYHPCTCESDVRFDLALITM